MAIKPSHHETTRVLCVDDHRLLIEGLKIRIAAEPPVPSFTTAIIISFMSLAVSGDITLTSG